MRANSLVGASPAKSRQLLPQLSVPRVIRLSLSPVLDVCCRESTRTRWGGRPVQLAGGTRSGGNSGSKTGPGEAPGGANPWRGQRPRLPSPLPPGHTPMRAAAAGHDLAVNQGRKWRTAGPVRLPPLISSRGEAPPPRDPLPATSRENDLHSAGERSIPRSVESPSHRHPRNQPTCGRRGVERPADAAAPSALGRSFVVSPAAGGNLTAAGDGITWPRTAPTKPSCAEPTGGERPSHANRVG